MSLKSVSICLKCSMMSMLLLLLQGVYAQYNFDKTDDWMSKNAKDLGGRAVLVIYKDGKVVYDESVNKLSRKQKMISRYIAKKQGRSASDALQDFDSHTRERIASCSKWLTAALVMTFVDEGKLSLTDTVGKFLPVMTQYGKGNIQVQHCLSHLTGIKQASLKESLESFKKLTTMDAAIQAIAMQPMEGEPGLTFHYGNAGLQIAAALIEKISGKSFSTLFEERIARPCKMSNTDFGTGKVPLAAGGAFSTANDYMQFLQMILNGGVYDGKTILSKTSIAAMQKNYVTKEVNVAYSPAEAGSWGYGLGEWVMEDATGNQASKAVSSPGLFGSFPWLDKEKKYAAFLFTFNIKNKGRHEKYKILKQLVDEALQKAK